MVPEIAYLWRRCKTQEAPGNLHIRHRRIHVEDPDVVASVAKLRGPYLDIAVKHLLRRDARLVDREHFVVGYELLAVAVELREIAAQVHGRVPQCPDR